MSKLLCERFTLNCTPELLKESRLNNDGKIILTGIVQKADCPNQNKRIYPMSLLRREVENYQKAIRENRATGQLDHPESSTVALEKVSHKVIDLYWEGPNVMGRVEILPTPSGLIAQSLLESGVMLGISSRGVGSTEKDFSGLDIVQPDFQIICWDLVSEPSTPGAFLFSEGRSIELNNVKLTKADRIFRALNEIVLGK